MNIYYEMTVPIFTHSLTNLRAILEKAKAFALEHHLTDEELLSMRLASDMFPFAAQVRIACDNAKGGSGRLAGVEIPVFLDNEKTLDELIDRVDRTLAFLGTLKPEQYQGAADRDIHLNWMPEGMYWKGDVYLHKFLVGNFFFHYTTAYDILRNAGMKIGKADFVGDVPMLKK